MNEFHHTHRGSVASFFSVLRSMAVLSEEELSLVIKMGGAYLGKRRCKNPDRGVRSGQSVALFFRRPIQMIPVPFDVSWIVDDQDLFLVASKPSGMPTQGTRNADYNSFYELLKSHCSGYLGLHHRLDQDTSGLLLFSRKKSVNADMARLFQSRRITKTYLALCSGPWPSQGNFLEIDAPIGPIRTPDGSFHRVSSNGKPARTEVTLVASQDDMHLVVARPITGRTHQIRVHLSHVQLPLLGDQRYGGRPKPPCRLHCAGLAWTDTGALGGTHYRQPPPQQWWQGVSPRLHEAFEEGWAHICPER